ncbi:MAG: hypothetical protein KR126chlam1_00945 [Chlamydiae bacterium]|nr:hypothetical protein [Chlamydiota bacterium]
MAFLLFLLVASKNMGHANEFEHVLNHSSGRKISKIQICGERCSGTNFIEYLLLKNIHNISSTMEFGQKHFLWWYGAPIDQKRLENFVYSSYVSDPYNLTNSEDCLFVVVIRDPYDWLRSFFAQPWHVHRSLLNKGFFHFIRKTWKPADDISITQFKHIDVVIDGVNPWSGLLFSNVLELRRWKNLNYLKLGTLVDNYVIAKYEDIKNDPEGFVDFVAANYNIEKPDTFFPIKKFKGSAWKKYKEKQYPQISKTDIEFINANIDWDIEGVFGYQPRKKVK